MSRRPRFSVGNRVVQVTDRGATVMVVRKVHAHDVPMLGNTEGLERDWFLYEIETTGGVPVQGLYPESSLELAARA